MTALYPPSTRFFGATFGNEPSSLAGAGIYPNEAAGRQAVGNGFIFAAISPSSAGYIDLWQKVNATTSTLLKTYPSLAEFEAVIGDVRAGYATRAAFAADTEFVSGARAPANGIVAMAGGVSFVRSTGATAIADLPGWLPFGDVAPEHFSDNRATGIAAAVAYTLDIAQPWGDRVPSRALTRSLITDSGWNPVGEPVFGRSTPASSLLSIGGHYDVIGAAGRNYMWGQLTHISNPNTAPFTCISGVAQGWKARGMDATARQCGDNGDGHALEVLSGQWAAKATVARSEGSAVLTVSAVTFRGSRFCIGNSITGTGIPAGATIVSLSKGGRVATARMVEAVYFVSGGAGLAVGDELVVATGGVFVRPARVRVASIGSVLTFNVLDPGDFTTDPPGNITWTKVGGGSTGDLLTTAEMITAGEGYPDTITISANATSSGTNAITVLSADTMGVGILISGSGDGGSDGTGNPDGRAIQVQSYGDAAFLYGINFAGSSLRTNGTGFRMASLTANRGASFESCTLESAINVSSGNYARMFNVVNATCSGAAVDFQTTTATIGLRFRSNCTFSTAALSLEGQDIATDTSVGMKIATSATQRLGFFGRTPVARPAAIALPTGGATVDAEARATIEQLRNALRTLGLIAT